MSRKYVIKCDRCGLVTEMTKINERSVDSPKGWVRFDIEKGSNTDCCETCAVELEAFRKKSLNEFMAEMQFPSQSSERGLTT